MTLSSACIVFLLDDLICGPCGGHINCVSHAGAIRFLRVNQKIREAGVRRKDPANSGEIASQSSLFQIDMLYAFDRQSQKSLPQLLKLLSRIRCEEFQPRFCPALLAILT